MKGYTSILICFVLMSGLVSCAETLNLQASIKCFHEKDYRFYDFKPLMKSDDLTYFVTYKEDNHDKRIEFDFCESLPSANRCKNVDSMAVSYNTDQPKDDTCQSLTQKPGKGESTTLVTTKNEKDEHLILNYTTSTVCDQAKNLNYGIKFEVICNKNITGNGNAQVERDATLSTQCVQYIKVSHKAGWKGGDLNGLWRFVESNKWIFAIAFMVIGVFNLFLGRKLIRPTLFIVGTMTTVAAIMFLFYVLILKNNAEKWVGWVVLSCSVILGLIVGFFAAKLVRVGAFALGVWGGVGIALILSNMVFYKINSVAVLWIMIAVFGLVIGVLSFIWFDYIMILSTSILGGYLAVRGLSLIAGGYPNEFTVYERIKDGDFDSVPGTFYAYMAGMIILIAIGIFIQVKMKLNAKKKGEEYDYYKKV